MAHISITTPARDFNFFPVVVQRSISVMVALAQKSFSPQYDWFCRGRSHIGVLSTPLFLQCDHLFSVTGIGEIIAMPVEFITNICFNMSVNDTFILSALISQERAI